MRRYHFHVFDGQSYAFDYQGIMLPDLTAVVAEAESRAQAEVRTRTHIRDWTRWKIDVRGEDDITIFHFPFDELRTANSVTRPLKRARAHARRAKVSEK
jgi:hypothetical protein